MTSCPACLRPLGQGDLPALASHLVEEAEGSDPAHVRWLNQNLTRNKVPASELVPGLERVYDLRGGTLKEWIKARFISKFFGPVPHPFVTALQHPSRATLLGYVVEHQHFLRQWVRSCAFIMARTDQPKVVLYELDNLNTEYGGYGPERMAHYELLLRMGESLGVDRSRVLTTPALPSTREGIEGWNEIATRQHWVAALAAMHSLELIANRDLVQEGATVHYFDPSILGGGEITEASKNFLREGYEADVAHSDEALDLVNEFGSRPDVSEEVQSTFLRSIDLFDDYLLARLQRAADFEA
ncbi:MAG TPA: iron-containing redox enzyme family protein [Thermoplasmata archaeon]|nr:iron-containing redox enzyme family protein [Thermoplasmata archaeon]